MWTVLNADALREAALVTEPFPHLIVGNIIRPEALPEVVASFPRIGKRGSFPPEAVSCWAALRRSSRRCTASS